MYVTVEEGSRGFRVLLISKKHPAVAEHKLNTDKEFDEAHFVWYYEYSIRKQSPVCFESERNDF